jgi:hypothetical protein
MTQDEIIEIYKEVSNKLCNGTEWCWAGVGKPLQLFAKLVAAKERAACAKIVGDMPIQYERDGHYVLTTPEDYEAAIRARGEA